jgi:RNA polymerase sigma-70 factor (ECF subfamily)
MDAEDLTQDTFIQAYHKLSKLKETDRFKSWIYSIAFNKIRDFNRKKRFRSLFRTSIDNGEADIGEPRNDSESEAEENLMKKDFWKQVDTVLDTFPKAERETFMLRFFDQLTIREMTQVLNKNESTVKTHLYRAIAKFKHSNSILELLKDQAI